jgi:peptidoglycan/xylan/chitin deacetylase (PgdA/CDA1 family)
VPAFILAYHSHNVAGDGYASNDHVAFPEDLRRLDRRGARFVPLEAIVARLEAPDDGVVRVALTFDDGPRFDWSDFTHPRFGPQRGFANQMRDFLAAGASQPHLHATSFVIASPEARSAMASDPSCGLPDEGNWLDEDWWAQASASGLVEIGNHSWDHVHHAPRTIALTREGRDDFTLVDNYIDADRQIRRAGDYIRQRAPCRYFAYPFGHVNAYLANDYLPSRRSEHGMEAAFASRREAVMPGCSRWDIPRMICGDHWTAPAELDAIVFGLQ